jgi:glucans biosynthesis protein
VQLVEIPTDDEIHDNIVAFWNPARPANKGDTLTLDYRLHWRNRQPFPPDNVARVVATRTGRGGVPGQPRKAADGTKFVIDFSGGPLDDMEARYDLTPEVTPSRGTIANAYVVKVVGTPRWRAAFDLRARGNEPVGLRCYLRLHDRPLSETWLYQYFPTS